MFGRLFRDLETLEWAAPCGPPTQSELKAEPEQNYRKEREEKREKERQVEKGLQ